MWSYLFGKNHNKQAPIHQELDELSASLNRYDRIFWGAHDYGFLDWNLTQGRTHWYGGLWRHLGYSEEDTEDFAISDQFYLFIHPDDRKKFIANMTALLKREQAADFVFRLKSKEGKFVWAEARVDAIREPNGRVTHVSGVIFDLTKLKAAEAALQESEARHDRIIKSSSDGLWEWAAKDGGSPMRKSKTSGEWVWNHDSGQFTFSSRCWELLGYEKDDPIADGELIAWRKLMHKDDCPRFDRTLSDHIAQKGPFDIEYRIRAADGSWRWVRGRGHMVYDEQGRPLLMSGTNMDVTELKHAEERVIKAKVDAEKANQAKSEFLSRMSHELRTPLNAILGFSQLFELDSGLSSQQRENILEIKRAGNHLLELVGDVLDLAKIEAGHSQLKMERVIVARAINDCIGLVKSQIEKHQLDVDIRFNSLDSATVYVDEMRLRQVFINLFGNSVKYNTTGGRVSVDCNLVGSERLRVSVRDTGRGITLQRQHEIFQPFNRLGAEHSGIEGSGVGLVITKQLVEQMGGAIGFESEENVGSLFWVEFPLCKENFVDQAGCARTAVKEHKIKGVDEVVPPLIVAQQKRILYVEDNPSSQKLMTQIIAKYPQLELTVVGLAVQGLFVARSALPDLILLDVNLPGLSGFEIVQVLKSEKTTQDIPVIALSANVLSHDILAGMEAGFDHYLTKPLNLAAFIYVLNQFLCD
ncbi:MAG: PAS domain S-box-containing protein [Lentisphaeria bacterium]|jgi:PAS domain S-box-containing protein